MGVASLAEGLDAMISCLDCLGTTSGDDGSIDTLLFVDVDGVLNVGIEDPQSKKAISFSDVNVRKSMKMAEEDACDDGSREIAEKIRYVRDREVGHGEGSTYARFTSSASGVCEPMAARLAQLIQVAGDSCVVVLTSSWRHPRHAKSLQELERCLAGHLGRDFAFRHRTSPARDDTPERRLRAIGDFIAAFDSQPCCSARRWRVLVLEDFHITAMDGWLCAEAPMDSTAAAESYLLSRIPAFVKASVKLVHTFGSWTTPSGLVVRVGTGLTNDHHCKAMKFLGYHNCPHCSVHP
mmetsp:Transcript_73867/g.208512  ORF Transcript_73867/g.208512 Transcript_73867/m.208512 type:complete len:294 (+) Transcript_73867:29-910(+)